jgi:Ca2+-binding EF-hand superfamily protein
MTIDIEKLILEIDEDGSGQIEFDEFTALLSGNKPEDEDEDED